MKGRSGAGKTTLFRLILGFLQPDEGHVKYKNEFLNKENVWKVRKSMAYVSQDMNIGDGKVSDFFSDVLSYEANRHLNVGKNNILDWFEKFSLSLHLYDANIGDLSGGEKQRVAIIASILIDRPVYLLDEVTAALDDRLKETIVDHFLSLEEKTVVVISHDPVWSDSNMKLIDLDN